MTLTGWHADPQWARALGAVALAFLAMWGVARAGGPLVLAHEARPVARVAAEVYCLAAAALEVAGGPATPGRDR